MVERALVERDHLGLEAALLLRLLLDGRDGRAARGQGVGRGHARLHRCVHRRRDVLNRLQCEQLQVGGPHLPAAVGREEALRRQVALRRAELVQHVERHVMVGEHQAVWRDERPRPAGEPHRRLLHALQPLVGDVHAQRLLDGGLGNAVERPEPLVRLPRQGQQHDEGDNGKSAADDNHPSIFRPMETGRQARPRTGHRDTETQRNIPILQNACTLPNRHWRLGVLVFLCVSVSLWPVRRQGR